MSINEHQRFCSSNAEHRVTSGRFRSVMQTTITHNGAELSCRTCCCCCWIKCRSGPATCENENKFCGQRDAVHPMLSGHVARIERCLTWQKSQHSQVGSARFLEMEACFGSIGSASHVSPSTHVPPSGPHPDQANVKKIATQGV